MYHETIGDSGEARAQFEQSKFQEAAKHMANHAQNRNLTPALSAFRGRILAESQDDHAFAAWLSNTNAETRKWSEYWAAVGTVALNRNQFQVAVRALAEAVDRDPTDFVSIKRLHQTLLTLNKTDEASAWEKRWRLLKDVMNANHRVMMTGKGEDLHEVAKLLSALDRPLESLRWKKLAFERLGVSKNECKIRLADLTRKVETGHSLPSQEARLCGLRLNDYPMPDFIDLQPTIANDQNGESLEFPINSVAAFDNVAQSVGLNHTYDVSTIRRSQQYAIYQTLGGGVAVLDMDLDGAADLYFAQAACEGPSFKSTRCNALYRNVDLSLHEISRQSGSIEHQYSIGVTSGDWNQDGFPDLAISNIGTDSLLINNGDGSFTCTQITKPDLQRVPSSLAMADVTGDNLPDLYHVGYVRGNEIDRLPALNARGQVTAPVSPGDYPLAKDLLTVNDARGRFTTQTFGKTGAPNPGLGILISDLDAVPGNEIFVGNDLAPNQLWMRDRQSTQWSDVAALRGCAFSSTGLATGSMGISIGDYDCNGVADIHISNYENENDSLYMGIQGSFRDLGIQFKLDTPTFKMVGFGTQSIDYNNDGAQDIVVTNGHLDNTLENSASFRQRPQLFHNCGQAFTLVDAIGEHDYWSASYLGRGLAKLDFDQDGMTDFVVTHIGDPSALLMNRTSNDHQWIQLRLVGTSSERDAIGAMVEVELQSKAGVRKLTRWVSAGDGYLSRNENVICFGLGDASMIDQIRVSWPDQNGDQLNQQTWRQLSVNQRLLLIEGNREAFRLR